MITLDSKPTCGCCDTYRDYIKTHLDPSGLLTREDDPAEIVAALDRVCSAEGGSGVSVELMTAYLAELPAKEME